jgi:hypothetical protein
MSAMSCGRPVRFERTNSSRLRYGTRKPAMRRPRAAGRHCRTSRSPRPSGHPPVDRHR